MGGGGGAVWLPGPRAEGRGDTGVGWERDAPVGCGHSGGPAVPVRGAADAGAVAGRAHSAGLLRPRAPGPGAVRRVAVPAHPRSAVPAAGPALVRSPAPAVRRLRTHPPHVVLPARPSCAGVASSP